MLILKNINNNRTVECIVDYNFHVPKVVFGGSLLSEFSVQQKCTHF